MKKNDNGELIKFSNVDIDSIENADSNTLFLKPLFPISNGKDDLNSSSETIRNIKNRSRN